MLGFRRARPSDLEALAAVSRRSATTAPAWTAAQLADQLFDAARAAGAHTLVATEAASDAGADADADADGRGVRGCLGWVTDGDAFFLSPLIAEGADLAAALLERGRAEAAATGARWIRCSAGGGGPVEAALRQLGYRRQFDFVDLARSLSPSLAPSLSPPTSTPPIAPPQPSPPAALRLGRADAADRAALLALYNEAFAGVPNSLPSSAAELAAQLDAPQLIGSASLVLVAPGGDLAAFTLCRADRDEAGPFAALEAVGVAPAFRRRGLAAWLERQALAALARRGVPEVRALVATSNAPSLQLHLALGFTEKSRRHVWQLDLPPPAPR